MCSGSFECLGCADKFDVLKHVELFFAPKLFLHPQQLESYIASSLTLLSSFWKLQLEGQSLEIPCSLIHLTVFVLCLQALKPNCLISWIRCSNWRNIRCKCCRF